MLKCLFRCQPPSCPRWREKGDQRGGIGCAATPPRWDCFLSKSGFPSRLQRDLTKEGRQEIATFLRDFADGIEKGKGM